MITRLDSLNIVDIAEKIIELDAAEITQLQKDQLLAGQDNEGNDLSPTYFTDPYFKTPAAAKRYSDWKDKITPPDVGFLSPYPDRKSGVPNLYITGYWHSGIRFVSNDRGYFINTNKLNPAIISKYPKALGLNPTGAGHYGRETFKPEFMSQIRKKMKL